VLDIGFGVHGVVLRLFVGGPVAVRVGASGKSASLSDRVVEVPRCSPSGMREGTEVI
jgi:hypothetical protein